MAKMATDLVSIDRLKQELRLGGATAESRAAFQEHDALLAAQIDAAVSFVAREIDAPLVETTQTLYVQPATGQHPLVFDVRALKRVSRFQYWSLSGALRQAPDGSIRVQDLGRLVLAGFRGGSHGLYPPATGWPAVRAGSLFRLEVARGLEMTEQTMALRQAIVLCVRQLYDGYGEIRPTAAFYALIQPWRVYG